MIEEIGKKGQIGGLQSIIATIIVIGILLGTAFLVFESFADELDDTSYSVVNETVSAVSNNTLSYVDTIGVGGFHNFVVTAVVNSSDGGLIPTTNYSTNAAQGWIRSTDTLCTDVNGGTSLWYCGSDWKVTYTYDAGETAWIGMNQTINATQTIPDLLGLLILIAIIGIILAVVFNVIPGARTGTGA